MASIEDLQEAASTATPVNMVVPTCSTPVTMVIPASSPPINMAVPQCTTPVNISGPAGTTGAQEDIQPHIITVQHPGTPGEQVTSEGGADNKPNVIHVNLAQSSGVSVDGSMQNQNVQTFTLAPGNISSIPFPISISQAGVQGGSSTPVMSSSSQQQQIIMTQLNPDVAARLKQGSTMRVAGLGESTNTQIGEAQLAQIAQLSAAGLTGGNIDWAAKIREMQQQGRITIGGIDGSAAQDFITQKQAFEQKIEPCVVCGDRASGRHYGAVSCEGCKGFFKRSIRKQLGYACRGNKECPITKHHRNRCQYCRLQKCLTMGMRAESVQSERKPPEPKDRLLIPGAANVATSTQKIYIRKDFASPSTAMTTFGKEKGESLLANLQERVVHTDHGSVLLTSQQHQQHMIQQQQQPPQQQQQQQQQQGTPISNADLSTLANVVTTLATMGKNPEQQQQQQQQLDTDSTSHTTNGNSEADSAAKAVDDLAKAVSANQQEQEALDDSTMSIDTDSDLLIDFEGNMLTDQNFNFTLTTPSPMPAYLTVHYICETASRLLFLSMHWARAIQAFQILNHDVQTNLVRTRWSELFTLGLAQCAQSMCLPTILAAIVNHLQTSVQQEKLNADRVRLVSDHIIKLQEYVQSLQSLKVDEVEYAYLKTMALFSPDHPCTPKNQLEKFQEKAHRELFEHEQEHYPECPDRFAKLLLRLPALRSLSPSIMEELFFVGLIGNVQIDSIIPYILRMETSDYNLQMGLQPQVITTQEQQVLSESPLQSGVAV